MAGNSWGKYFRLTTFGESHGQAIGGIIDGCPAGFDLDLSAVQAEMDRRRPGQSALTTPRKESDEVQWLSGLFEGRTTGAPLAFTIANRDVKSADYAHIADQFRPSHADEVYQAKYAWRDYRGGGRSSARETACRVAAGAVARQLLGPEIKIAAYVSSVGDCDCPKPYSELDLAAVDQSLVRCPDPGAAAKMEALIEQTRREGDSLGGIITGVAKGLPAGWGQPVFDKLHADLGKAMLSINAVKGFEIGSGFAGSRMRGSAHNDIFDAAGKRLRNYSGGVQGGISNAEDIYFRVAFKPVATVMQDQQGLNAQGEVVTIKGKGRHDPCVVPRAVPIVEAMTALVLIDHALAARGDRWSEDLWKS